VRINRGLLGWGVFFIVVGLVPLAVQAGMIDEDVVRRAWQLWPLILIGIGLGLVLARTRAAVIGNLVVGITFGLMVGGGGGGLRPGDRVQLVRVRQRERRGRRLPTQAGTLDPDARVSLDLSCGELTMAPAAGSGWSLSGTSEGGVPPEISAPGRG
jgi:hypothetical protein